MGSQVMYFEVRIDNLFPTGHRKSHHRSSSSSSTSSNSSASAILSPADQLSRRHSFTSNDTMASDLPATSPSPSPESSTRSIPSSPSRSPHGSPHDSPDPMPRVVVLADDKALLPKSGICIGL